jgi:tellurite resistance protein
MTQATRVFYLYIDEARYGKFQKACELLKKIGGHSTSSDALIDLAIASADGASEPEE